MQRRRLLLVIAALVVSFGAISGRLVWLQGFEWREYHLRAESYHRRVWAEPAPRGSILDRDGRPIAFDVPSHEVVYTLDGVEPVRWVCRRVEREIRGHREGRDFPYDSEQLWASLEEVRAVLRPGFAGGDDLPRYLWLSRVRPGAAAQLSRAVARRPESFPGIEVDPAAGEVWIRPEALFAGEIAVRRIERRLGLPDGELFLRIARTYARVQDPALSAARRDEIYRVIEHRLIAGAPPELVEEIVTHPERFPGLRVREVPERRFVGPAGIAPLIGRVGERRPVDEERWRLAKEPVVDRIRFRSLRTFAALRESSHHSEDLVGHSGIERVAEERLRGRSGGTLLVVDHRQNPRGEPIDAEPPRPGEDIAMTLDTELCALLDELAATRDPRGSAMLVADCRTGEILGWSSYPAATPDVYRDAKEYARLVDLDRGHFFDRPANYAMEPGSIFKTLIAIGALEDDVVDPAERILCDGHYDPAKRDSLRCANHALGIDVDLHEALLRSCNVYFYRVGGDRLGLTRVWEWARRFGFWQPVACQASAEATGQAPRSSAHSVAIGKAFTTTPLAVLRYTCMLANRGRDPGLALVAGSPAVPLPPVEVAAETWRRVISGMVGAVADPRGTASDPSYGLGAFDCAVKTGTAGIPPAQLPPELRRGADGELRELNRAWIIGFAPVEAPRLAFVIALERVEGHGGDECAPIAARILEWFGRERGLDLRREAR